MVRDYGLNTAHMILCPKVQLRLNYFFLNYVYKTIRLKGMLFVIFEKVFLAITSNVSTKYSCDTEIC